MNLNDDDMQESEAILRKCAKRKYQSGPLKAESKNGQIFMKKIIFVQV